MMNFSADRQKKKVLMKGEKKFVTLQKNKISAKIEGKTIVIID